MILLMLLIIFVLILDFELFVGLLRLGFFFVVGSIMGVYLAFWAIGQALGIT